MQENSFIRRLGVSKGAVNGLFLGATATHDYKFDWTDESTWDYENFQDGVYSIFTPLLIAPLFRIPNRWYGRLPCNEHSEQHGRLDKYELLV